MAQDKLTVSIGADIDDLQKGIAQAEKEIQNLKKLKSDNIKIGADTSQINTAIDQAKAKLATLKTSATGAGNAMQGFQKQTANGGVALTAFSRIAQDAPYGIIGIGNNITNTAEQFQYLAQKTGSAGGAVKAMLSSLAGIGGVMLGISLLVTGLTIMSQKGITVGDVFDMLRGKNDALAKSFNNLSVEAVKGSGAEIAGLNALISVAQNKAQSDRDRLTAVEKLQTSYPGYFGNLEKEKILNGDLTGITKELTKAIIARARATAAADKVAEIESKILAIEIEQNKDKIKQQKQTNLLKQTEARLANASGQAAIGIGQSLGGISAGLSITTSSIADKQAEINALKKEELFYIDKINKDTATSIKLEEKKASVIKTGKPSNVTPQVGGVDSSLVPNGLVELQGATIADSFAKMFPSGVLVKPMSEEFMRSIELMMQFNEDLNNLIDDSISGTFDRLGTAIGESLVNGGNVLQAIGQSLLQSLGAFLSDLGGMLIKYGTLAVIKGKLDLAILTGGPVSIAAGLAAIAVGVALKAAGGAIGSAASGGSKSSSGGSSSNYSTSSGGFSTASSNGGTVVFEIAGQKLIGVLSNTIASNKRMGGQNSLGL